MPSIQFEGKALVQNFHLLVPYHELKRVKSKSLTGKVSLHDNLVVERNKASEGPLDVGDVPVEELIAFREANVALAA